MFVSCVNYISVFWFSPRVRVVHRCPPPPTVTENMSVVTNNSPNFLPRLSSELASQHPLVSVMGHYNIASVFITYGNLKFFTTRVALKTIIFDMVLVTFIIVVILLSPLKYNLSQHAFLAVVRSERVA